MLRPLLALAATLLVAAAPVPNPAPQVRLTTELGPIDLALDARNAPVSTANFLRYVDQKRFDGIVFYRVMRLEWGTPPNGLIQGGTRGDPKRALKPIAHEPTDRTGIKHLAGTISMARNAPGTAAGDWSILLSDMPGLDANPTAADADGRAGYAAFGRVVGGMEVVRRIWDMPLSPTAGQGVLKGQMLAKPVRILTARRVTLTPKWLAKLVKHKPAPEPEKGE